MSFFYPKASLRSQSLSGRALAKEGIPSGNTELVILNNYGLSNLVIMVIVVIIIIIIITVIIFIAIVIVTPPPGEQVAE